jgi:hypothetical protein
VALPEDIEEPFIGDAFRVILYLEGLCVVAQVVI